MRRFVRLGAISTFFLFFFCLKDASQCFRLSRHEGFIIIVFSSFELYSVLWAGTSGTDGRKSSSCKTCNPYHSFAENYMTDYPFVVAGIQCYIAGAEAEGYDMSRCVSAAVVDDGATPFVSDAAEHPGMGLLLRKERRADRG